MFSNQLFYEPEKCAYPETRDSIPPSKLGYHTNNKYEGFPPLMMDGRSIVASWQPEAVLNEHLLREINVKTNWQYRQYLIKNAKDIMKYNCTQAANDSGYLKRYTDLAGSSYSTPYVTGSFVEPVNDRSQLTDLKESYLSREQLQARMVVPEITQEDLLRIRGKR